MEQPLKNYIVKPIDSTEIEEIYAFFDSREKANNFLNRFKTCSKELEILEIPLNPEYIVNKLADPYRVTFQGDENRASNCEIYDTIEYAAAAEKETYELSFFSDTDKYRATFDVMLFASSEQEAIAKGRKRRNEVIASGEWDIAHKQDIINLRKYLFG